MYITNFDVLVLVEFYGDKNHIDWTGITSLLLGRVCHMVATRFQGPAHVCTFIQS